MNISWVSEFICLNSHCFAFGSVFDATVYPSSSFPSAQVHLAMVQLMRECRQESSIPYIPHKLESAICLCTLTSFVGINWCDSRRRNVLTFPGTAVFQRDFHSFSSFTELDGPDVSSELEGPDVSSSQASLLCLIATNILYADHTVKFPFFSKNQLQNSGIFVVHKGIPRITLTSIGMNTSVTLCLFHVADVGSINSDTRVGGFCIIQP